MKYLSDFERCGFDETEIVAFLDKRGIKVEGLRETSERLSADGPFPEWKHIMALLPHLTESEAASAFAGIDMTAPGRWLSDEEQAEFSRWKNVIERAARAVELVAIPVGDAEWVIEFDDLAAWCTKKGWPYPLPGRTALPATDAGLRDALSICETERARWKAKANSMEAAGNQHTSLVAEIDRLRGELRDNTDELAALTSERDALKVDTLSGKAKTTALRIIGGLAMKGYGMDIHADRLERIGEIVKDLQMSGADVTEKTLRMWIKEAAKVIEPPKKMA